MDEVKHTRDYAKELAKGGCKPSHGCNAANICICDLADDAITEVTALRALVTELVAALGKLNALVDFTTGDENLQYLQLALEIDDPAHLRETLDDMAIALAAARAQGFEP